MRYSGFLTRSVYRLPCGVWLEYISMNRVNFLCCHECSILAVSAYNFILLLLLLFLTIIVIIINLLNLIPGDFRRHFS